MELRHLRYFIAAAEEENISRAALKLHVSQPGISRQIRDLEEEIGFKLFERTAKSLKLTEAGKVFLKEARAVLQRADDAIKNARAVSAGTRELHIGYAPSLTARFLPQALRAFQSAMPNVRVKLHDCSTEEMLADLRQGKLQLALTVRVDARVLREFNFTELARETLMLAISPKHRFAKNRSLTLDQIVREPIVSYSRNDYPEAYRMVLTLFAGLKIKPKIVEEHDSVSSLIAAVEAGAGVAVVPNSLKCTAGWRLKFVPISPPLHPIVVGAYWAKKMTSGAAEKFLQYAKEMSKASAANR
jgi:LysR family transcriptional regulator, benzoate and cis,cis-muconate-responsive activator of ben and cat genes